MKHYERFCEACEKQTTWTHYDELSDLPDMPPTLSAVDRCYECGADSIEAARRAAISKRICTCGVSLKNHFVAMGVTIEGLDYDEELCNSCRNQASAQLRVDDDLDRYGYEDNWSDV